LVAANSGEAKSTASAHWKERAERFRSAQISILKTRNFSRRDCAWSFLRDAQRDEHDGISTILLSALRPRTGRAQEVRKPAGQSEMK
jgi:hypothetical protein